MHSNHGVKLGAVHRYYESRRRIFNDQSASRKKQVVDNVNRGKKKSRQRYVSFFHCASFVGVKGII